MHIYIYIYVYVYESLWEVNRIWKVGRLAFTDCSVAIAFRFGGCQKHVRGPCFDISDSCRSKASEQVWSPVCVCVFYARSRIWRNWQTIEQYNTLYRALFNTNRIFELIIILKNNIFDIIKIIFVWIGNPKYHLCFLFAEHFQNVDRPFWKKRSVFLYIYIDILFISVNIWSIFVDVRFRPGLEPNASKR